MANAIELMIPLTLEEATALSAACTALGEKPEEYLKHCVTHAIQSQCIRHAEKIEREKSDKRRTEGLRLVDAETKESIDTAALTAEAEK
ncbi:MAG: hypothetical protein ABFD89_02215 [Bryobacteraceae bacterium]